VNDLGTKNYGKTALYLVCEQGFLAVIEQITAARVDANEYCYQGETVALQKQHLHCKKLDKSRSFCALYAP